MADLKKRIQDALVAGAENGLSGDALYQFVKTECPKAKGKRIVHVAFFALSDPDLKDRKILDALYAFALSRRLGDDAEDDGNGAEESDDVPAEAAKKSKAASLPLPEASAKKSRRSKK